MDVQREQSSEQFATTAILHHAPSEQRLSGFQTLAAIKDP